MEELLKKYKNKLDIICFGPENQEYDYFKVNNLLNLCTFKTPII
jgi:hypothetical protein